MEMAEALSLISGQPESYAILAVMIIFGWKYFPVLKKKVEIQASQLEVQRQSLESAVRQEKLLQDIVSTLVALNASMQTFATKDDVIDLALHRPPKKVVNGSGSVVKQGIE